MISFITSHQPYQGRNVALNACAKVAQWQQAVCWAWMRGSSRLGHWLGHKKNTFGNMMFVKRKLKLVFNIWIHFVCLSCRVARNGANGVTHWATDNFMFRCCQNGGPKKSTGLANFGYLISSNLTSFVVAIKNMFFQILVCCQRGIEQIVGGCNVWFHVFKISSFGVETQSHLGT